MRARDMQRFRTAAGFSFIELSILMVMASLVMIGMLEVKRYTEQRKLMEHNERTQTVLTKALAEYIRVNKKYPCPADPGLAPDHPQAGVSIPCTAASIDDAGTGIAIGSCNALGTCRVAGLSHAQSVAPGAVDSLDSVLIGAVPYVVLGLTARDVRDAWNMQFAYAVTMRLATEGLPTAPNMRDGSIRLLHPNNPETGTGGYAVDRLSYMFISFGSRRAGAYGPEGVMLSPCNGATRDGENCDRDDAIFLAHDYTDIIRVGTPQQRVVTRSIRTLADTADFYDSYLYYRNIENSSDFAWSSLALNLPYAYFSGDKVGIGNMVPKANLDVSGSIRGNVMGAEKFCDPSNNNCFSPANLGAEEPTGGYSCEERGGLMTGIEFDKALCTIGVDPTNLDTNPDARRCGTGKFSAGVDENGRIICVDPP
jgi:hypothetical protein